MTTIGFKIHMGRPVRSFLKRTEEGLKSGNSSGSEEERSVRGNVQGEGDMGHLEAYLGFLV